MLNLPEYVAKVISVLERGGHSAYAVGGCVRDMLMGRVPNDYDVTTDAKPDETAKLFSGFRVIETGIKHGTVTVISDGHNVEITTYRIDGEYTDNRHPNDVTYTTSLEDDLSRRDFTVNAMAYNSKDGLVDVFGGREDIERGLMRCVGEPNLRFGEDGLRILRALRFSSTLGFDIDGATAEAIHGLRHLLSNISVERILAEFSKLLCGVGAEKVLLEYRDVFEVFFPTISECDGDTYKRAVGAALLCEPIKAQRYAAYLGICCGADKISPLLKSLNSDNKLRCDAAEMYELSTELCRFDAAEAREALSRFGLDTAKGAARLRFAVCSIDGDKRGAADAEGFSRILTDEWEKSDRCLYISELRVNGEDLMGLGICGAAIGKTLGALLSEVMCEKLQNDREKLIHRAKQLNSEDK